jgi:hypothetical protein
MSMLRALSLLLLGAMAAAGQVGHPAAQQASAKPSELCSVEGVVVKSTTGEGIKNATVQLSPIGGGQQAYSTLTEKSGRFIIRDIAPGRYRIRAGGSGYTQQTSGKSRGSTQARILDLAPGKDMRGFTFRLVPPGVITGTVYDEEGDPVTLAQVKALRVAGSGTRRQLSDAGSAQTNDLGEYRIWGLQPGQYLVAATYQHPQTDSGEHTDEVSLPTFHPSAPDPSQATVIEVQAGAEVSGADVDVGEAHAVVVRGRVVVDGPVNLLRRINVLLSPHASSQGGYSFSDYSAPVQNDSGDFEVRGVPPGSYMLSASCSDGKRQLYGRIPVEVSGGNLDGLVLVLGNPMELPGRFRVEGSGQFAFTQLGLVLQPLDGTIGSGDAQVNAEGTFVVPNLYDGNYRVRVFGLPEGYYVKSARLSGSDVLESGLTISHSQSPGRLEVVLSPDGGRVEGTVVKDQNPVRGAWVVLAPDLPHRDRAEMYNAKMTDAFGHFTLLGLSPGGYKLFAWEPVAGTDYSDPNFFETFEDRGTPVHIQEGQQETVQLDVITSEDQLR